MKEQVLGFFKLTSPPPLFSNVSLFILHLAEWLFSAGGVLLRRLLPSDLAVIISLRLGLLHPLWAPLKPKGHMQT